MEWEGEKGNRKGERRKGRGKGEGEKGGERRREGRGLAPPEKKFLAPPLGATITIPSQVSRYSILPQYRKCAMQFQCRSEFASLRL